MNYIRINQRILDTNVHLGSIIRSFQKWFTREESAFIGDLGFSHYIFFLKILMVRIEHFDFY